MATLTEEQLKTVLANIIIEDHIEFDKTYYDKAGRITGYYNSDNFSIDNDAIQINMCLNITKPESLAGRIDIHLKEMYLGDELFNLTDFKQQQLIKEKIKEQIKSDLD